MVDFNEYTSAGFRHYMVKNNICFWRLFKHAAKTYCNIRFSSYRSTLRQHLV